MDNEMMAGHTLADCFDWLAVAAAQQGRTQQAAHLFGAAEVQWRESGAVRYAPDRPAYAADIASVRAQLGNEAFALAWAAGQTMRRGEAIALALEQTNA